MNLEHIPIREVITPFVKRSESVIDNRFLKGPIPWRKIAAAANVPGQGLIVYLCIHHVSAMARKEWIKLPPSVLRAVGVSRDSKSKSLRHLADAGLIELKNAAGRASLIKLTL